MNTPPRLDWISTSADDLRVTLDCEFRGGRLATLLPAMRATRDFIGMCVGQTTRRKILNRFIRLAENESASNDTL